MGKANKTSGQEVCTLYIRPPVLISIAEGAPPWAPSLMGLKSWGKLVDMASLPAPDGNSARKGEGGRGTKRERDPTWGKPDFQETSLRD